MRKGILDSVVSVSAGLLLLVASSCSAPKNVAYFQDVAEVVLPTQGNMQIKLEPGDRISIVVKSKDPELANAFNLTVITNRTGDASISPEGMGSYIIGPDGYIDMPVLGRIKVEGMTRSELAGFITGELRASQIRDAVVSVELMNATFSAMGEVQRPGNIQIEKDGLTLLEAISLAGDLTIQGQRDNVAVVRQETDGIHTYRVDLTNLAETVKSPAYYIKQGDVIYVEPNGIRKRQTTANGNNILSASFWVSVASLLTSVAVLVVK